MAAALWHLWLSGCAFLVVGCSSIEVNHFRRQLADDQSAAETGQGPDPRAAHVSLADTDVVDVSDKVEEVPGELAPASHTVGYSPTPRTVRRPGQSTRWSLGLTEAIQTAMQHNPIIRQNAQFLSPNNPLVANPQQTASTLDPEIQLSSTAFGQRGESAALGDFDPQLSTGLIWGKSELVQNNQFLSGGLPPGATLAQDTANFDARLEKPLVTGGSLALVHNWDYIFNNQPNLLFPSAYSGPLALEIRQSLLAGAGVDFTEIAGPNSQRARGGPLNQGIRIARINEQVSAIDFDLALRGLVKDVCDVYWQLFAAYAELDAEIVVRDAAQQVWKEVSANQEALGGSVVAQAESTYYESQSRVESIQSNLLETETRLRRLLGLPAVDDYVILPNAIPLDVPIELDWDLARMQTLEQRPEVTRQKLQIQSLDYQLQAARSLARPKVEFVGGYQLNGFGDRLLARNRADGITSEGYRSAYGTLLEGKQTGWNLGLQVSLPLGFRTEEAQIRNAELNLMKGRAALAALENELEHELTVAFQTVDKWYQLMQTNASRRAAAERQTRLLEAEYLAGRANRSTVDLLLRARLNQAQATIEHVRSVAGYNQSLIDLDYRCGTILSEHQIALVEGTE